MKIPFYKYISELAEHSNVSDVLDGEEIDQVELFEKDFAKFVGSEYALSTASGTAALHLAMLALDLKRGDKVVCSVNTHPSVPEVVRHFDAEPIFIDIDEENFHLDLDRLEEYLQENANKKLKAIIVTLLGGVNFDLARLYKMANDQDIRVVIDAAEALGSSYEGEKIGSVYADITCFDFSPHLKQNICSGGMLVTDDEEIYNQAKLLSNHGVKKEESSLAYIYDVIDIGNDYRLSQLDAAYLRAGVDRVEANIQRQQAIAAIYNKELEDVAHVEIPKIDDIDFSYNLYMIKIDKNRDSFALDMQKEGVETGLHYIPLHLLSYYKSKYELRVNDFPKALRYYQQILSLPIYPSMSDEEVKYVCDVIKKVAKTKV
ncbi:UDP-4-amino-4-deoxy-L-arabinose--oxoglutarate aminotransferase [hydrothermal vent metagenome]|uniref:UDP-4-amino-4-deoxy-L-arabinose--oxoglutarate aminotransferase n=1 Tax=hydrothermal vent metagenome TaxID=652676 RepID=A0A1W1BD18_9ZZZZ